MAKKKDPKDAAPNEDRPLYVISVAAELVDMHPQTLRLYERKGLIEPSRSSGQTRLYSQRDIDHLREIRRRRRCSRAWDAPRDARGVCTPAPPATRRHQGRF